MTAAIIEQDTSLSTVLEHSKQLAQIGADLEPKIAAADRDKTALTAAQQESRVFRATGERRVLIDQLNALRKDTYGKVAGMPHKQPDENLPGSFADRFFKSVSRTNVKGIEELSAGDPRGEGQRGRGGGRRRAPRARAGARGARGEDRRQEGKAHLSASPG